MLVAMDWSICWSLVLFKVINITLSALEEYDVFMAVTSDVINNKL